MKDLRISTNANFGLERSTVSVRLQGISRSRLRREGSRGEPRLGLVLAHASVLECCTNVLRKHRENLRAGRYASHSYSKSQPIARPPNQRKERNATQQQRTHNDLPYQMGALSLSFVAESAMIEKDAEDPVVIVNTAEISGDDNHVATQFDHAVDYIQYDSDSDSWEEDSSEASSSDCSSTSSDEEDGREDELPDFAWAYSPKRQVTIDISQGSQEKGATLATLCYSWEALDNVAYQAEVAAC